MGDRIGLSASFSRNPFVHLGILPILATLTSSDGVSGWYSVTK